MSNPRQVAVAADDDVDPVHELRPGEDLLRERKWHHDEIAPEQTRRAGRIDHVRDAKRSATSRHVELEAVARLQPAALGHRARDDDSIGMASEAVTPSRSRGAAWFVHGRDARDRE